MQEIIMLITVIITAGVFGLIFTLMFIYSMDRREDVCCYHKPEHVHSPDRLVRYFECKKCGDRSFKTASSISSLEDSDVYINNSWLCGHDRIL